MKFYVLKHPEKGYLKSKKYYRCTWTDDIQWAKKWSYSNHPKNVIIQTTKSELEKCSVIEIEYEINVI